jgi:hypothetical protein
MADLASLRQLKVDEQATLRDDQDACVVPGRVLLNRRKPSVRRRYSLAHEIVHTLFPDYEDEVRRLGALWRREGDDSELERLCQVGAAELLFPIAEFTARVERMGLSLSTVLVLAREFDASAEAAARRGVETSDEQVAAFIARPFDGSTNDWLAIGLGDQHQPYAELRVASAWSSPVVNTQGASGAVLPKDSSAVRAWRRGVMAQYRGQVQTLPSESWLSGGLAGTWRSESVVLPPNGALPREVLCVLTKKV